MLQKRYLKFLFALFTVSVLYAKQHNTTIHLDSLIQQNKDDEILKQIDAQLLLLRKKKLYDSLSKLAHSYSIKFYRQKKLDFAIKYALVETEFLGTKGVYNDTYAKAIYQLGYMYRKNGDLK